eukprot:9364369-Pyramimonas_sp.AAC.1
MLPDCPVGLERGNCAQTTSYGCVSMESHSTGRAGRAAPLGDEEGGSATRAPARTRERALRKGPSRVRPRGQARTQGPAWALRTDP